MTTTTTHLVCLFCVTAGQNGENLGSDEEQIVLFVYLLYDIANNKVYSIRLCLICLCLSLPNNASFPNYIVCSLRRRHRVKEFYFGE